MTGPDNFQYQILLSGRRKDPTLGEINTWLHDAGYLVICHYALAEVTVEAKNFDLTIMTYLGEEFITVQSLNAKILHERTEKVVVTFPIAEMVPFPCLPAKPCKDTLLRVVGTLLEGQAPKSARSSN